jgi:Tfp pilus assembly protein PilF
MASLSALAVIVIAVALIRALTGAGPLTSEAGQSNRPPALLDALDAARKSLLTGQPGAANAVLVKIVERYPEDQEAHSLFAESLLELGEPASALMEYEAAIAIGPEFAELSFAAGSAANMANKPTVAEIHYLNAQDLNKTNSQYPLYLGTVQRNLGKTVEAQASLLRAVKLDPSLANAWGQLADMALEENKLSLATTHITRARTLEPTSENWRLIEARILRRQNKPENAARLLMAIDTTSRLSNPMILREIALCFGMLSRPDEAAALFAEAAELRPDDPELLYEAALWHDRAERSDRALGYAIRAAELGSAKAAGLVESLNGRSR